MSKKTAAVASEPDFWRGDALYWFTAWAQCDNKLCCEFCAVSGIGSEEECQTQEGYEWELSYSPRHCTPMPDMVAIPEGCPKDIAAELREAFKLFWGHPASCAGRIRVALECLMDYLKIKKRFRDKQRHENRDYSLHQRIRFFEEKDPKMAKRLMAIKWLGNSGSHVGTVEKDDLLDAFDILEYALHELIGQRVKDIDSKVKSLTKKHAR